MLLVKSLMNDLLFNDFVLSDTSVFESRSQFTYKNGEYELKINVPGYGKEDLNLSVDNGSLTLISEDKKINQHIWLPKSIDVETLESSCEKGVLRVTGKTKEVKKLLQIK